MVWAADLFGLEGNIALKLASSREKKGQKKEKRFKKGKNSRKKDTRAIPHHSRTISRTIRHLIWPFSPILNFFLLFRTLFIPSRESPRWEKNDPITATAVIL